MNKLKEMLATAEFNEIIYRSLTLMLEKAMSVKDIPLIHTVSGMMVTLLEEPVC